MSEKDISVRDTEFSSNESVMSSCTAGCSGLFVARGFMLWGTSISTCECNKDRTDYSCVPFCPARNLNNEAL